MRDSRRNASSSTFSSELLVTFCIQGGDPIEPASVETDSCTTSGDPESSEDFFVDLELIGNLLRGDAKAWEYFVDRYSAIVRSRVVDVAGLFGRREDWSTIDDVTAEVFASLLASDGAALRCFRGQSRLSTYLSVIATRVARRKLGRLVGHSEKQTESMDNILAAYSSDPQTDASSMLIGVEEREQLLTLVQRLPQQEQQLLVAFYREEQTYAEISHRFEIPIGSVGSKLRRAEKQLRKWIDDETE